MPLHRYRKRREGFLRRICASYEYSASNLFHSTKASSRKVYGVQFIDPHISLCYSFEKSVL